MAFHLTVAGSLEPLADALAAVLAEPLDDPFTPELVAVPGGGVQAWLVAELARRLGATASGATDGPGGVVGDGIVANVEFVFPAGIVARAVGEASGIGRWATGPLTWAVHEVLQELGPELGQAADAVRARAIADLFDRYTLYRPQMVRGWSDERDLDGVGAPLEPHQLWQPTLWRAVQEHLGGPTDAELLATRAEALETDGFSEVLELPDRVAVFGLASLPPAHLRLLAAVARHVDVHVLAPASSPARWLHVAEQLPDPLRLPVRRGSEEEDPLVPSGGHPLVSNWGRPSREANLLLLDQARKVPERDIAPPERVDAPGSTATVLERVQHAVRADEPLPVERDRRPLLDTENDVSIRWHRAYGPARQVEVLRDALLHLFEELDADDRPRFEARDVAILCSDVSRFAPLIEATFAGDPDHGVPAIPVRIADRSLGRENPLLDAAGGLLDLLDGRFRASSVLAFAARGPVSRRFGLDVAGLDAVAAWADATNVRWGLTPDDQLAFGLPAEVGAHTWRDGLDQLLVGSTMAPADDRLGPGDVAPFPTVEADSVDVVGALADLLDALDRAVEGLRAPGTVDAWCTALSAALVGLCEVPEGDSWQWQAVERVIEETRADASVDGVPRTTVVDPGDLAALLRGRLATSSGRPRFATGSVTVSSLTAQRAVPHRVVCLLGLDDDTGSGSLPATDDLVAARACVGDRDTRSEQRALMLDALLAADERLLLFSTGHDVRTNAVLPATVMVAELVDVIDTTVRVVGDELPHRSLVVDHPRQAWSERALQADELGLPVPWSFDRGARAAALARREQTVVGAAFLADPLPEVPWTGEGARPVPLDELVGACANPSQALLRNRLGVSLPNAVEPGDDQIPLDLSGLDEWRVAADLLTVRLSADPGHEADAEAAWLELARRRGAVPPLSFGDAAVSDVRERVDGLLSALRVELSPVPYAPEPVDVAFEATDGLGRPVLVTGRVDGVCDDVVVNVTASTLKAKDLLVAWAQLVVLTAHDPSRSWRALTVGRKPRAAKTKAFVHSLTLRSPKAASEALDVLLDLHRRVHADAVPAFAETTRTLHTAGLDEARAAWEKEFGGDRNDRWIAAVFGSDFDAVLALPLRDDESGEGWLAGAESRLHCWADRLWGTLERTAVVEERDPAATAADGEGS